MVEKHGPTTSYGERAHKRMQLVYAQQTRERQYFMQELQELRKQKYIQIMRNIKELVGPTWYQVLSVPQRDALDTLEFGIYQDLLEGRPTKTSAIMRKLGLYPRPSNSDLMTCNYAGRDDPKAMIAELYLISYGHPIGGKCQSYNLNARLMLSAILYLGLKNLIELLRERFKPDPQPKVKENKQRPKPEPPLASPYLQKMVAVLYDPPRPKRGKPPPLPTNLEDLNEPVEEEPPVTKPPPLPPPPPPPKKRLPRTFCDKVAGYMPVEPFSEVTAVAIKTTTRTSTRRQRGDKLCMTEVKKTYGICMTRPKKGSRRKKLTAPSTGIQNTQYLIQGVYTIGGKTVFVLSSVSILPAKGELIHGGFRYLNGELINIHNGYRGFTPAPKPDPCNCVKLWQDKAFRYIKENKCYCGHRYDYGNEGTFPPDEPPYFQKPTPHAPFQFNYHTIFDIDEKSLLIEKEFKRVWDTDSVIGPKNPLNKDKKKIKKKRSSKSCLGERPKPEDYLKCALRQMRHVNIAAKLPDVHQVPELREWMRRRIYGPYSPTERREYLRRSNAFFQLFTTLAANGFGHVATKPDPLFHGETNWLHKLELKKKFNQYTMRYKLELFRSFANLNNMLWSTMYPSAFPDKKFREIYFSYLHGRVEDLQLMHPYNTMETNERAFKMARRRIICLPAGIEPEE
ncbi:hypothetical protein MSG28_000218 [Choristoneura fumiferana]|uniref:Uncharacterized protein n=1 Tax=Choristoneura fumiferana TaxID=7141 RepID=A0ACC0K068_CHOFU|nr:hypothetical protein MSG28_000218 [Choristoneura fumiferana]